jgi:hypothetical protein
MDSDEEVKFTEFVFEDEELKPIPRAPKKTKRLLFVRDMCSTLSKVNRNCFCSRTDRISRENLDKIYEFITSSATSEASNTVSSDILASSAASVDVSDIYLVSSPLIRAESTAKFIHTTFFKNTKLRIKYHEYFREIKTQPADFFEGEEFIKDTRYSFGERQKLAFDYLTKTIKENNIIIVTHEKFISQLTQMPHGPGECVRLDFDIF